MKQYESKIVGGSRITFNRKVESLRTSEAVKFGTSPKLTEVGQLYLDSALRESSTGIIKALKSAGIKSGSWSGGVSDSQISEFKKFYADNGITPDVAREFDKKVTGPFKSLEYLILTGLLDSKSNVYKYSDFGPNVFRFGMGDGFIYSLIYGGARLKVHQKFSDFNVENITKSFNMWLDYTVNYVVENGKFVVNVKNDREEVLDVLNKIGQLLEVEVEEPRESDTWTITLK